MRPVSAVVTTARAESKVVSEETLKRVVLALLLILVFSEWGLVRRKAAVPTSLSATDQESKPKEMDAATPEKSMKETSNSNFEPFGNQRAALDEARNKVEDWKKRRREFLEADLKLTEAQVLELEKLRAEAIEDETFLLKKKTSGTAEEEVSVQDDLVENRQQYEADTRKLLGHSAWKSYTQLYFQFWEMKPSERVSLSAPLK